MADDRVWWKECLPSLDGGESCCYMAFLKRFILSDHPSDDYDDMLYFVQGERVQVRRVPADKQVPQVDFTPNWRSTLALNVLARIQIHIAIELVDGSGAVKSTVLGGAYPTPNKVDEHDDDPMRHGICRVAWTYPQLSLGLEGSLVISTGERIRIALSAGDKVIVKEMITFGQAACRYHKEHFRGHRPEPGDLSHAVKFLFKEGSSLAASVRPFFRQEIKLGVRSALYSLLLGRFPRHPEAYLVRPAEILVHWEVLLRALMQQ